MAYLQDYIHYYSGTEVPEEYCYWSGLSILGHLLGRKVWVAHGDYFKFTGALYVAIVGEAGTGKNTGLAVNKKIMTKHFPEYLISASIQSREDIAMQMGTDSPTNPKTWKDALGAIKDYRPFYVLNNELASFLSVDKVRMVEFLTELFDGEDFSTGFKKDRMEDPTRRQWFSDPHFSMLAGAVPTFFMDTLKMDLFSRGLGRRMIIVNSTRTKCIPNPKFPQGAEAALARAIEHLKLAEKYTGEIKLDAAATKWWADWYIKHRNSRPMDPILSQFWVTEPMQVLKVALCLHMCEYPFKPTMDVGPLKAAEALLTRLKPEIVRLTSGIGRNELAGVGAQIIDFLERTGGMQTEVNLKKYFHRYLNIPEFQELENHYIATQQIMVAVAEADGVMRKFYFTPEGYQKFLAMQRQAALVRAGAAQP
jgi:hypothetical protein